MCLVIVGYKIHPGYPLIITANRDEYRSRPTERPAWWENGQDIFAGKDLTAGGSWLGVNRRGWFAAVTNYREGARMQVPNTLSRGALVTDYLTGELQPEAFLLRLSERAHLYSGFNLLLSDGQDMYYFSNREGIIRQLEPGLYGLSNHLLDSPWPKVVRAKAAAEKVITTNHPDVGALFALMRDTSQPPDNQLPDTGVGLSVERRLATAFIDLEDLNYGTRVTTVLLQDNQQQMYWEERSFTPGDEPVIELITPVTTLNIISSLWIPKPLYGWWSACRLAFYAVRKWWHRTPPPSFVRMTPSA
ncbi:MAG: NRDE family protein [Bacteroidia bacterium]|nr:NRDE family protein [Bacteroidia bacterium]